MRIDPQTFTIHDVTQLPFVVFNEDAAQPGYANQWETEMVTLMESGRPFVIVYDQYRIEESHDDRTRRGVWLKHNKTTLARVCKALISIEPDEERRTQVEATSDMAANAFRIPHVVVATRDEALTIANQFTGDAAMEPTLTFGSESGEDQGQGQGRRVHRAFRCEEGSLRTARQILIAADAIPPELTGPHAPSFATTRRFRRGCLPGQPRKHRGMAYVRP